MDYPERTFSHLRAAAVATPKANTRDESGRIWNRRSDDEVSLRRSIGYLTCDHALVTPDGLSD